MLGTLLQGTENKNAALRLREMVTVLRRHEIVHGLTRHPLHRGAGVQPRVDQGGPHDRQYPARLR